PPPHPAGTPTQCATLVNVVSIDEVIAYGLTLPRSTEGVVRGRRKLYIGRIVYVAHEAEDIFGFAHPKEGREALIETDPEKLLMPIHDGDLRWTGACVRISAGPIRSMRTHAQFRRSALELGVRAHGPDRPGRDARAGARRVGV